MTAEIFARLSSRAFFIHRVLSLVCAAAALLLGYAGYRYGLAHQFDHWMVEGIEYENVKMAAALSELVYHIDKGYMADTQVWDTLRRYGFTIYSDILGPLGETFPHNMSNVALLDHGLKEASSLGTLAEPKKIIAEFRPVEPNDLGLVDFYRFAFALLGIKIESLFRFYYLLHFSSILLFIAAFWRRLEAMTLMLAVVAAHFFNLAFLVGGLIPTSIFAVATPYNERFIAGLGVLSALHIALTFLRPPPARIDTVVALIGQTAILYFVVICRRSAAWQVLWAVSIPALFITAVLADFWKLVKRWRIKEPPAELVRRGLAWPVLTALALLVVLNAYYDSRADPVYRFADEFIPEHMFWHSAFVGLSVHPDWQRRFGNKYVNDKGEVQAGDALPPTAAAQWIKDNYGLSYDYFVSPIYGLKYRTLERATREAYLDFIAKHKRFALQLHVFYKPKLLYDDFRDWDTRTLGAWNIVGRTILAGTLILLLVAGVALGIGPPIGTSSLTLLLLIGAAWATVPSLLVFPSYPTMSDQALMLNTAIVGLVILAV